MKTNQSYLITGALFALLTIQNSAIASTHPEVSTANDAFQYNEYPIIVDPNSTPQLTDPTRSAVDALLENEIPVIEPSVHSDGKNQGLADPVGALLYDPILES